MNFFQKNFTLAIFSYYMVTFSVSALDTIDINTCNPNLDILEDKSKYEYRFLDTVKVKGKDKAAELYIERCNFYSKNGTRPNWDGIEKLDFK